MKNKNGTKTLYGVLFGHVCDVMLIGLALQCRMDKPVLFVLFGGAFVALAVFLGITACNVDAAEREKLRRAVQNGELLEAQNAHLKRGKDSVH